MGFTGLLLIVVSGASVLAGGLALVTVALFERRLMAVPAGPARRSGR
jgi:hypothetical protein